MSPRLMQAIKEYQQATKVYRQATTEQGKLPDTDLVDAVVRSTRAVLEACLEETV